ncbi:MAG: molecular chaperone DnaJ [Alphaproteobacteria bacterium]|nr:molecular chaperone DnaJ [Alphaproteobacteria bacterium]
MQERDYYELLGVSQKAGLEDIKRAYRKLAMQYHPDRNQNDKTAETKFKEINEAYEVLKDDQKRAQYDHFGHQAFKNGGQNNAGADQDGFSFHFGGGGFSDIFQDFFSEVMGGGNQRGQSSSSRQRKGTDLRYDLSISLEEAFKGREENLTIPTKVNCQTCKGSGAAEGTKPITCSMCQGHGKVRAQQGFFTIEKTCPSCAGRGQTIEKPCKPCRGKGAVKENKNLKVSIPAGIEEGTRLRLKNEGEAGLNGGPSGDLYVFISIETHPIFQRNHADLYYKLPIRMTLAALGGTIDVPTIDSTMSTLSIEPGAQSGRQYRLKNKGMPILNTQMRGDLYVDVMVETPVNLTKRQRELLEEFKELDMEKSTSPESIGFFDKLKDLFK